MQTEALRANLERTAVAVDIPARHEVLLEISEPLFGVHQDTERLLLEIHHPYVGWVDTLPELHRRAMNDVYLYNEHALGPAGLAIFAELYAKAAREANPTELRREAVRWWLAFLRKIVEGSGTRLRSNLGVVRSSLEELGEAVAPSSELAASASSPLRRLTAALLSAGGEAAPVAADAAALLRQVLTSVYSMWLDRDDPAEWFTGIGGDGPVPSALGDISHDALRTARARLQRTGGGDPGSMLGYPGHAAIVRGYFQVADELEGAVEARTRWLCLVLGEELLAPIHERALWTLGRFCTDLIATADREQFETFLTEVFTALRSATRRFGSAHLDLVRKIGVTVLSGSRPAWSALVVDEILKLDFQRPEFAGFTDEWSVVVNPNHLKNVRTYMEVIGANPAAASRLLAALVVHLEAGGVFIADTDLFQKDVSRLLAADIGPVYHQVRSLLRRLPVYFSDIGAEGRLRDVSTRIDEIRARRDPICHFLRKQCHVESNPQLMSLVEQIGLYWASGDPEPLLGFLPDELHGALEAEPDIYAGLHTVFSRLAERGKGLASLFAGGIDRVEGLIAAMEDVDEVDRDKALLLFRLRHELARKYRLDHADLLDRLRASTRFERREVDALKEDLSSGRHEAAIDRLLGYVEALRDIVLSTEPMEAVEDIYRKRHIGTGIPSMYGSYREPRLEAMGLSFRIESLIGALTDRVMADHPIADLDEETLQWCASRLSTLARGLDTEGYWSQGLDMGLSTLHDALALPGVSRDELADVLRGITQHIHGIVRSRVLGVYGDLYERLAPATDEGSDLDADLPAAVRASEGFLRNLIAESMSLQRIDNLSAIVQHAVNDPSREWLVASSGVDIAPIDLIWIRDAATGPGALHVGNKAAMLGRLADYGFPIPRGFIIPTRLARERAHTGAAGPVPEVLRRRILDELATLERESSARFGDPVRPLLLSVRGGAPISMPGMLGSFLNVGINPGIAEGVAARSGSAWAAWDAYRRFLQFWGMSRGLDRDLFDALMSQAKARYAVPKKAQLTSEQMARLALEYRELVVDHEIEVVDDPVDQLFACIDMVVASWDSAMATMYRAEMGIADGWGTAVIVQSMVYGNLHQRSGTGVLLTQHPHRSAGSFELFGDFVIQGQGDDVVSGLVDTFPISELQRAEEPQDAGGSLEQDFPEIYATLERLGRSLVEDRGWNHQEIEFTFEGDRSEQLFILQTREAVVDEAVDLPVFRSTSALARARIAVGIGVGGGAVSCRLAQDEGDIARIRFDHPDDPVLLVRPDTVPDDIHLLLQSDALLTAIGGATSHAAVVARRLGKTCVVGCRDLKVYEAERRIQIAGRTVEPGDWVSINGVDGSVYLGRHETAPGDAATRATMRIGGGA